MNAFDQLILLAQEGGGGSSPLAMLPAFLVIGFLFYILLIRPQKREQANRKLMIESLKKNDHVVTVAGIYGVVMNVRPEIDEVIVKVDESTNAKLRMTLSSIARVVKDEPASEQPVKPV